MFTEPALAGLTSTMPEKLKQKNQENQPYRTPIEKNNYETRQTKPNSQTQVKSINEADEYFQQGKNCLKNGQYQNAIDYFTMVIRLNPNHEASYLHRGVSKIALKKYYDSIDDFNKVIELNPKKPDAYFYRGTARNELKQYESAINDYNKAIQLIPNEAIIYKERGLVKTKLKQYESAINDFNKAIELKPMFVEAYGERGIAKARLKQYEDAISDFTRVIQITNSLNHKANAYYNMGAVKLNLSQYESALNDFNLAIQINPNFSKTFLYRGITKIGLKQYDDAIADFKSAIGLDNKDDKSYMYMGLAKCGLKQYESARYDYMYSIRLNPNNPTAYYLRGIYRYITYYNYNEKMSAFEDLEKASSLLKTQNTNKALKEAQKVDIILKSLKENRPIYGVEIDIAKDFQYDEMPIILKLDKKTTNELNSLSTEFRNENTSQPTKQIKQYNTSLPKNASNIDESVWISYLSSVQKQIKKNWKPKFDKSQSNSDKLTTSVLFEINPKGNIIKKQIIKKSSNQKYDKSVSNAISQINKFAPLPNSFNENLNFVFDFTYVIRDVTKEKDNIKIKDGIAQVSISKEYYNCAKLIGKGIEAILTLPITILLLIFYAGGSV